jgi:hypothetical protein
MRRSATILCSVLLAGALVRAGEGVPQLLKRGWDEYAFQTFPTAQRLFRRALNADAATDDEKFQARYGLAMIVHYQMPGRDPAAAIPVLQALLDDLPAGHRLRPHVLADMGACHVETAPPDFNAGRTCYRKVLETVDGSPTIVQTTALRLISSYLRRPSQAEFQRGTAAVAEVIPRLEGTPLESSAHGLAALLAYQQKDIPRFAAELKAQYAAGIENIQIKANVLFQIARVSEVELHDFKQAERYYRMLAEQCSFDIRAHFAKLRAAELARGKVNSDYAPPVLPEKAPAGEGE